MEDVPESGMEDEAFSRRNAVGFPDADVVVAVTWERSNRAGNEPSRKFPAYDAK